MWKQLLTLGLVLAFVTPAGAIGSKNMVSVSAHDPAAVYQQDTCKEGEVWDETEKKCKKKEG